VNREERPEFDVYEDNGAYYLESEALDLKIASDRTFYRRWKVGEDATKQHVKADKVERGLSGADKTLVLIKTYHRGMEKTSVTDLEEPPSYDEDEERGDDGDGYE